MTRARASAAVVLLIGLLGSALVFGSAALGAPVDADAPEQPTRRQLLDELNALQPRVAAARRRILEKDPDLYALALLKLDKAQLADRQPDADSQALAAQNLSAALAILRSLLDGDGLTLPDAGLLERAYLASNDLSAQPYLLYVPESYDGTEPFGLIVFLHAQVEPLSRLTWAEEVFPESLAKLADGTRCLAVVPYGRGKAGFRGIGEADCMAVIRRVEAHHKVDDDRVFLAGDGTERGSLWRLAIGSPDVFAGIVAFDEKHRELEAAEAAGGRCSWLGRGPGGVVFNEFARNLQHVGCVVLQAPRPPSSPPGDSEAMWHLLHSRGFDARLVTMGEDSAAAAGAALAHPEVLACLKRCRRVLSPSKITFYSLDVKHTRAYWAEVLRPCDWRKSVELECSLGPGGVLGLDTDNVAALRLTPPPALLPEGGTLRPIWNGEPADFRREQDGSMVLGPAEKASSGFRKTRAVSGPIGDAFMERFVLVYGARSDADDYRQAVEFAREWLELGGAAPTVLPAEAVTDQIIRRCNLILFGSPEANPIVRRIAARLPIQVTERRISVGGRNHDPAEYGLLMVHPNPLCEERYVVLSIGGWPSGCLARIARQDAPCDFVVFPKEEDATNMAYTGRFDAHWRLDPASIVEYALPAPE